MPTTYKFEELDPATHEYLCAVRDREGRGAPGVFASTSDSLPGCGCVAGPILIAATLGFTLISENMVLKDPVGLALLQTAGLLLGAWLFTAKFRSGRSRKVAGNWVYLDPLHLYEAYREEVTVTPVDEAVEASVTHNYNNNAYTNSVVQIQTAGRRTASVTVPNETRAEQMRVFLNYLAWARGPEGGERANYAAATLGGLAKYVARNGDEPLDPEGRINIGLLELDVSEVPEGPTREGRAMPSVLPYVFMILFAAACFCVLAFVVNPLVRDEALYNVVMKEPAEPALVRVYLLASQNDGRRATATERLSRFYKDPIDHVQKNGADPQLREAMAKVLDSLRTAEQPVVSLRVTEKNTPAGKEDGKANREKELRTQLVNAINAEFSRQSWGQPVRLPNEENPPPRSPIGEQFVAFVEPPEGADKVHFDLTYSVNAGEANRNRIGVTVAIRTSIAEEPVAQTTYAVSGAFDPGSLDSQIPRVATELARALVGQTSGQPRVGGFPKFQIGAP